MPHATRSPFADEARFFRSPALPDTELLAARFFRHSFAPHWHEGYVVAVITAGAEGYRYKGARHVAEPWTLACINPGEIHTGERAAEQGWAYRVFYPDARTLADLARQMRPGAGAGLPRLPQQVVRDAELAQALVRAHLLLEADADRLEAQTAALDALCALLSRHGDVSEAAAPKGAGRHVAAMRERLAANLSEPLTLEELGRGVGLSAFHAARLFARETGMPPHAWRNALRVNRSLPLLRAGASVAQAASACGFADQSHFTRHFRRVFGIAPGRWRA